MTTTLLGNYGTLLVDTPIGMALYRVTDAVTAYCLADAPDSPEAAEMADAATRLCALILDLLLELRLTVTG